MNAGVTLVELIAALTVLTLGMAVAALALGGLRPSAEGRVVAELNAMRSRAIASGTAMIWRSGRSAVRFSPDGSSGGGTVVVDGRRIRVDPFTGHSHAEN